MLAYPGVSQVGFNFGKEISVHIAQFTRYRVQVNTRYCVRAFDMKRC